MSRLSDGQLELLKEFEAFTFSDPSIPQLFDRDVLEAFVTNSIGARPKTGAKELFESVRSILEEKSVVEKESETCSKIIEPLLDLLCYREKVGASKKWLFDEQREFSQDGCRYIPDYTIFSSHQELTQANNSASYFSQVRLILEAKRVGKDLLRKQKSNHKLDDRGNDSVSEITPISQIRRYLRASDVSFGILTNGDDWILVAKDSRSAFSTYHLKLHSLIELIAATNEYDLIYQWWVPFSKTFLLEDNSKRILNVIRESEVVTHSLESDLKGRLAPVVLELLNHQYANSKSKEAFLLKRETHIIDSVRFIYMLLYIGCLEDRNLLPVSNPIYRYRFSLRQLFQTILENEHWLDSQSRSYLVYEQLNRLVGLVDNGCNGLTKRSEIQSENRSKSQTFSIASSLRIEDRKLAPLLKQVLASPKDSTRIASLRSLDTVQFGNIYEHILKLEVAFDRKKDRFVFDKEGGSSIEKSTAVYTPHHIVDEMVRTTLDKITINSWRDVVTIKMVDPCFGSAHFLVEFSRQLAQKVVDSVEELEIPLCGYLTKSGIERRLLVQRFLLMNCIYGVDRSLACIHVAKYAIWLSTALPGEPPIFVDLQLGSGNSLFGKAINELPQLGSGDRKVIERVAFLRGKIRKAWSVSKNKKSFVGKLSNYERLIASERQRISQNLIRALIGERDLERSRSEVMQTQNPFIWWLEFPEVFTSGGFTVYVTNPPYDQLKSSKSLVKYDEAQHQFFRLGKMTDKDLEILKEFFRKDALFKETLVKNVGQARYTDLYEGFLILKDKLLKRGGIYSLIVPNGILAGPSTRQVRKNLWKDKLFRVQEFPEKDSVGKRVFRDRKVACAILYGERVGDFTWAEANHAVKVSVYDDANVLKSTLEGNLDLAVSKEVDPDDVPFIVLESWQSEILKRMKMFSSIKVQPSLIKEGDLKESENEAAISNVPKKGFEPIFGNNRLTHFYFNFWPKQGDVKYCDRRNSTLSVAKYADYKRARIVFKGISGRNDSRVLCASALPTETLLNNNVDYILVDDLRALGINEEYYLSLINSTIIDRVARIQKKKDHNGSELISQLVVPVIGYTDSGVDPTILNRKERLSAEAIVSKIDGKLVFTQEAEFVLATAAKSSLEAGVYLNSLVNELVVFLQGLTSMPLDQVYQVARKAAEGTVEIDELTFDLGLRGKKAVEVKELWANLSRAIASVIDIQDELAIIQNVTVARGILGSEDQAALFIKSYGLVDRQRKRSISELNAALAEISDMPEFEVVETLKRWLAS